MERINPQDIKLKKSLAAQLMVLRHLAAYHYAQPFVNQTKKILDLGCGIGYGTLILAQSAPQIIGLDVSVDTLPIHHDLPNAAFIAGKSEFIPIQNSSIDLVVSFQVIEHIKNDNTYLKEISRILSPKGCFILSTPNKSLRLYPFQKPNNPYHIREYDYQALKKILQPYFTQVEINGLQAKAEIMALEHQRLKQNPLRVYADMFLPSFISTKMKQIATMVYPPAPKKPFAHNSQAIENSYSIKDFWIESHNTTKSLDLIGICYK